jgi:hypothetical protein
MTIDAKIMVNPNSKNRFDWTELLFPRLLKFMDIPPWGRCRADESKAAEQAPSAKMRRACTFDIWPYSGSAST